VSKVVLRASLDEQGGALVKNDWAHTDAEILDFKNFSETLATNNCHLLRRPGIGLSELAGSLRHGIDVFRLLKDDADATGFAALLDAVDESVLGALDTIDQKGPEGDRSKKKVQAALRTFFEWLDEQPDLYDKVKDSAIAGARIYLSSMALLQSMVLNGNIATWIEMIPSATSDSKEFEAWKNDPASRTKMVPRWQRCWPRRRKRSCFGGKVVRATAPGLPLGSALRKRNKMMRKKRQRKRRLHARSWKVGFSGCLGNISVVPNKHYLVRNNNKLEPNSDHLVPVSLQCDPMETKQ
jgi:hypothetical protein